MQILPAFAKTQRFNMSLQWLINIEEISIKAKLPKRSKDRYSCCRESIFPFIPIDHIIIDTLHHFLHVSDVLIN